MASYQKQIEANPDDDDTWNNLIFALGQQDIYEEAVATYRKQIEITSDDDNAWNNLGVALDQQGMYEEAVAAYRKQIEAKPDHNNAWYGLGVALYQQGRHDEAIAAYRKHIDINPDDEDAWLTLGVTLIKQGKLKPAQQAYANALRLYPEYIAALSHDAELALLQNDSVRCLQRIAQASKLVDNKNHLMVILAFFSWLAKPASNYQNLLNGIYQLDPNTEIIWDFSDIEPAIKRLNPAQQKMARWFIDFMTCKISQQQLFDKLNNIEKNVAMPLD
jgi:tetratricopeptide (TPR) repeat protein